MIPIALVFAAHCFAADPIPAERPVVHFLRIVVLDTSGSMVGENIRVVREELLEAARQLPPSPELPIVVVPFHSKVDKVYCFTEPEALRTYLTEVAPKGGTSIATGLEHAIQELGAYGKAKHVCVLLYTDGEDADRTGIERQQQRLNTLFAERQKHGLKQTVVFCKRWEGACAGLVKAVKDGGNARVIDAGQLRVVPATLVPEFAVGGASWTADGHLEVRVAARIAVRTAGRAAEQPPLKVRCLNPGVTGTTEREVRPGADDATVFPITLPLKSTDPDRPARVELEFRIAEPAESQSKDELRLPFLPVDVVRLPVVVPPATVKAQLSASLSQPTPSRWADAAAGRATVPLLLAVEVGGVPAGVWREPAEFRVRVTPPYRIVSGKETFTLTRSGTVEIPLIVETTRPPARTGEPNSESAPTVNMTVTSVTAPNGLSFAPSELPLSRQPTWPAPVVPRITGRVLSLGRPQWVDVERGLGVFSAEIETHLDNAPAAPSELHVRHPSSIKALRVDPRNLRTGRQVVTLFVRAEMRPAPEQNVFVVHPQFGRDPPRPGYPEPVGWQLTLVGPTAPQVVLRRNDSDTTPWVFVVPRGGEAVALQVTPELTEMTAPGTQLVLNVSCEGALELTSGGPNLRLNQPATLHLVPNRSATGSFFQDTTFEAELIVLPTSSSVVQGSRQRVVLQIEAGYKSVLLPTTVGLAALAVILLLTRLLYQLKKVDLKPHKL
jgi:hypothetical protein